MSVGAFVPVAMLLGYDQLVRRDRASRTLPRHQAWRTPWYANWAAATSSHRREFLADIMTPNGRTVGEILAPQIEEIGRSGLVPALMAQFP